ncbi:MAG TPA: S-methyl-5-thioribose-1-phosphate isomerase [Roseiflexaceae bacterium]|nr:S-methyl-5-thioribose-1-phosphate isomerase [Roseiflexaceae bacterium]
MSAVDTLQHIWWQEPGPDEAGALYLLDQRLLPAQEVTVRCATVDQVAHAITSMQVRGAPAIGCSAAYAMVIALLRSGASTTAQALEHLAAAKAQLDAARPTAVNLAWATSRMLRAAEQRPEASAAALYVALRDEAHAILAEDLAMCHAMGRHGLALIPARGHVLTHCNAGGLATAGYGTALAPIRAAHEQGRPIHVFVDETRPFLQGARLTAWELQRAGVPLTLITDNMSGYFMRRGEVDCVIVGADRVVANGDIANKIGTYSVAVLAKAHGIPFYVAAPSSTVDFTLSHGDMIPIEQRDPAEVTSLGGQPIAPAGVHAAHPAFDITPHDLITAIITERGVVYPPFEENLRQVLQSAVAG